MTSSKFSDWWENNPDKAEAIRSRRRERYANDSEFAEAERARKRKAYAKTKTKSRLPKPKLIWHNERMVEVWSVGRVAEHLGIHKRTIAAMEARKAIPVNRFTDSNGRRWWPSTYVKWLKTYFDQRKAEKLSAREFSSRVWNDWKNELTNSSMPVMGEVTNEHHKDKKA